VRCHISLGIQNTECRVLLTQQPSLVEQAYEALLGEIADGTLAPSTHLIQEVLAARYGVSRQPIQQALLLLKSDGIVQDAGRRGLVVAPLDLQMMRDRYQVRAALDGLAARLAAGRCAASPKVATHTRRQGERILKAGCEAVDAGAIKAMIAQDVAFHAFVYEASGNPMIGPTAEIHWRFLRRVMGEVLRRSEPPAIIWQQHRDILDAVVAGDPEGAEARILDHIHGAAGRLTDGADDNKERAGANGRQRAG
jgi:DNA-binding GntR family transcriptional regulator